MPLRVPVLAPEKRSAGGEGHLRGRDARNGHRIAAGECGHPRRRLVEALLAQPPRLDCRDQRVPHAPRLFAIGGEHRVGAGRPTPPPLPPPCFPSGASPASAPAAIARTVASGKSQRRLTAPMPMLSV